MLHRDDYENAVKLIVEVIKRLDKEAVHNITFNYRKAKELLLRFYILKGLSNPAAV